MQYATLLLAAAGLAAAQQTTAAAGGSSQTSGCGTAIDNIINACLASTSAQASSCGPVDWQCKCAAQQTVNTCYNNCPSAPGAFGSKQTEESWCNAAKAYPSSSSSAVSAAQVTSAPSSTSSNSGAMMPSSSGANAQSTSSRTGGADVVAPATGFLAAVLGVVALI